ncbi:MAG: hypothetical protein ACFE7I_06520 [Candidatus Hodarchaeota archaeon]
MQSDDATDYLNNAVEYLDKAVSTLANDNNEDLYNATWHARAELECFTIILALGLEDDVEKSGMLKRARVSSKDKKKDILLTSAQNFLNSTADAFEKKNLEDALMYGWKAKEMLAALIRLIESES